MPKPTVRCTYQIIRVRLLGHQLCELNYTWLQEVVYFWQTHKSSHIHKWLDLLPSCELSPAFLARLEEASSFLVMGIWRREWLSSRSSMCATNFASGPAFSCVLWTVPIPLESHKISRIDQRPGIVRSVFEILTCNFVTLTCNFPTSTICCISRLAKQVLYFNNLAYEFGLTTLTI